MGAATISGSVNPTASSMPGTRPESLPYSELLSREDRYRSKLPREFASRAGRQGKISVRMRTAIVHYWLVNRRGGEKVVEALCRLLPNADIFTLFYEPEAMDQTIRSRRVTASFLNPLRRYHRLL